MLRSSFRTRLAVCLLLRQPLKNNRWRCLLECAVPIRGARPQGAPMGYQFPQTRECGSCRFVTRLCGSFSGARGRLLRQAKLLLLLWIWKLPFVIWSSTMLRCRRCQSHHLKAVRVPVVLCHHCLAPGNNPDYEPFLKAIGAADATDDIFAVQAHCPITNLDHADMAWMAVQQVNNAKGRAMPGQSASDISLTESQIKASAELKSQFLLISIVWTWRISKAIPLSLDEQEKEVSGMGEIVRRCFCSERMDKGTDLSSYSWLKIENGKAVSIDFDQYVRYMTRQKLPPAFDAFDLSTPENQEFGTSKIDKQHFTAYSMQHTTTDGATLAESNYIKMMNPLNYIGTSNTTTSKYWRIRHGSYDKDTGLAICIILGTRLQNLGYDVNLALPWNKPHSGDYDLDELFDWIDGLYK